MHRSAELGPHTKSCKGMDDLTTVFTFYNGTQDIYIQQSMLIRVQYEQIIQPLKQRELKNLTYKLKDYSPGFDVIIPTVLKSY